MQSGCLNGGGPNNGFVPSLTMVTSAALGPDANSRFPRGRHGLCVPMSQRGYWTARPETTNASLTTDLRNDFGSINTWIAGRPAVNIKEYRSHIIFSETTRAQLTITVQTRDLGEVQVRGRETPIRVHEITRGCLTPLEQRSRERMEQPETIVDPGLSPQCLPICVGNSSNA
jgi:hypothetical protein